MIFTHSVFFLLNLHSLILFSGQVLDYRQFDIINYQPNWIDQLKNGRINHHTDSTHFPNFFIRHLIKPIRFENQNPFDDQSYRESSNDQVIYEAKNTHKDLGYIKSNFSMEYSNGQNNFGKYSVKSPSSNIVHDQEV